MPRLCRLTGNPVSVFALIMLTAFMGMCSSASALTITFPDISYDSQQGAGQNLFTPGRGVYYVASTGLLSVSAKALAIDLGLGSTSLVGGTVDFRAGFVSSSAGGGFVTGNFGTDGVAGVDFVVRDNTGVLLEGNFVSYTMRGIIGNNLGVGEALVSITGGSLSTAYGAQAGVVDLEFNITPRFSATSFSRNFSGAVKGDVGALVPEPSILLLVGTGLVGMGILRRIMRLRDSKSHAVQRG